MWSLLSSDSRSLITRGLLFQRRLQYQRICDVSLEDVIFTTEWLLEAILPDNVTVINSLQDEVVEITPELELEGGGRISPGVRWGWMAPVRLNSVEFLDISNFVLSYLYLNLNLALSLYLYINWVTKLTNIIVNSVGTITLWMVNLFEVFVDI